MAKIISLFEELEPSLDGRKDNGLTVTLMKHLGAKLRLPREDDKIGRASCRERV